MILRYSKYLFFLLFLLVRLVVQSQEVSGRVTYLGKGIPGVLVSLPDEGLHQESSADGRFSFPYKGHKTKLVITVQMMGFIPQKKMVTLPQSDPVILTMEEDQSTLEEVVVSGTLSEMSKKESAIPIEVFTAKFFKANPTPSMFESLQNVNGVRPQLNCNVCNTGDIHINGLEGPYTMVMIDGMPIVSGLSTVYGLTGIPQSLIERMEVIKGPASTLYGSEAVGGLINIITKSPQTAPVFSADVFMTSWAELNADLGFSAKVGKARTLAGINYFNYQLPIDNNGDGFTDKTLQHRISVFNKWTFPRQNQKTFSVAGRLFAEDRWGGQMNWSSDFRGGDSIYGESIYTKRWELFGVYDLPTTANISLQFSANGHHQDAAYGTTLFLANQYIGFAQLIWRENLGIKHKLLLGLASRYTFYDDNTIATEILQNETNYNAPSLSWLPGVFVQDEWQIRAQHKMLMGLRYDHHSAHGSIFSPRINYKWNSFDKQTNLRIGVGNGYRVANVFTEDHAALTGAREVIFAEELKPERSWNINLNLVKQFKTRKGTFYNLDGGLFYTHFNNRIIPDYDTHSNYIIYSNLEGYSVSRGISLSGNIDWNNGFKAMIGATLQDVYVVENGIKTDQILTESVSGVWKLSYTFQKSFIKIDYTGNLYGPMRLPLLSESDPRDEYAPYFSIQNIQVSKDFHTGWEVYIGVKNLLNFTPPANSIARAHDPFDKQVDFDEHGEAIATPDNPYALTFDPTYVYASNQGVHFFAGVRYNIF